MFPYYGSIKGLHQTLRAHRKALKRAYRVVLGETLYRCLQEADETLLDQDSFAGFELVEAGSQLRTRNNKFAFPYVASEMEVGADGHFSLDEVTVAPGFIFTEEGFANTTDKWSASPSYLGSYLHEYDHFVLLALQRVPLILTASLLCHSIGCKKLPPELQDVEPIVRKLEGALDERRLKAQLLTWGIRFYENYEEITEYLDVQVLEQLGYKAPRTHFRPGPRMFIPIHVASINATIHVLRGSCLLDLPPKERVPFIVNWAERFGLGNPIQLGFMESLRKLKVERIKLAEMMRDDEEEEAPTPAQE